MTLQHEKRLAGEICPHHQSIYSRTTLATTARLYLLLSPHTFHGLLSDVRETGNLLPRTMYTQAHFYTFSPECGVVDVQVADVFQPNKSVASINVYRRDNNSPQSVEMEGV